MPKLSRVIAKLQRIQEEYGDLNVKTMGYKDRGFLSYRGKYEEIDFTLDSIKVIRPKTDKAVMIQP
jgi:hypothetical protein